MPPDKSQLFTFENSTQLTPTRGQDAESRREDGGAEHGALARGQGGALFARINASGSGWVCQGDFVAAYPPLRTNRTRRVPPPVLIGHAASLSQVGPPGRLCGCPLQVDGNRPRGGGVAPPAGDGAARRRRQDRAAHAGARGGARRRQAARPPPPRAPPSSGGSRAAAPRRRRSSPRPPRSPPRSASRPTSAARSPPAPCRETVRFRHSRAVHGRPASARRRAGDARAPPRRDRAGGRDGGGGAAGELPPPPPPHPPSY